MLGDSPSLLHVMLHGGILPVKPVPTTAVRDCACVWWCEYKRIKLVRFLRPFLTSILAELRLKFLVEPAGGGADVVQAFVFAR